MIPIDLVTQQAEAPIRIPGQGGTHAIVVLPGGRTVLAASGSTIVPVDAVTRQVGAPLDLGPGRTIFGMALDPTERRPSTSWWPAGWSRSTRPTPPPGPRSPPACPSRRCTHPTASW